MKQIAKLIGKGINSILLLSGYQLRRIKDNQKNINKKKAEDFIWRKASNLPKVPTIIDIGIGPKATPGLYKHFPHARYVFIDPLEECRKAVEKRLEGCNNIFIASAVGSTNTCSILNVARKPSRSSFYKRGIKKVSFKSEPIEQRKVPVQRLDDIILPFSLETPFGIKIDTEGYELEVLRGATSSLKNSSFVIVEFHFSDSILNSYTLQDILTYMEKAGFYAYFMLSDGRNIVFINKNHK